VQRQQQSKVASSKVPAEPAPDTGKEVASSDVQTRQAIDAYQRYGQPANTAPTERAVA
jgi:hypothetical protein